MTKGSNPFNPNSVVTPTLFAGRSQQVFQILKKLRQVRDGMPASFVLTGDRGIGKTALAKLIMYAAESNDPTFENLNFLTTYYSVERDQTFDSVLQAALNGLTDRMPKSVLDRLSSRLGSYFKNGKFTVGAFGSSASYEHGSKEEASVPQVLKDRAVSALSNIITGIEEATDASKKLDGVLIVIDEIHNAADIGGVAQILRGIVTTLDVSRLGRVSFMVIGYPYGVEKFFEGDPSARRHFDVIELSVMPREDAKSVLMKGFDKIGLQCSKESLEKHIDTAGGYPHSIQIIGHNLVEQDRDGMIDEKDWGEALSRSALELQSKDFSEMYDFKGKMTLREQLVNVLALAGRPMSKLELKDHLGGKNIYTASCLGELKKSGAVTESTGGILTLHSMLFRAAVLIHIFTQTSKNTELEELVQKLMPTASQGLLSSEKK